MPRTITPQRAIAIALKRSPVDGSQSLGLALYAFAERGRVVSEFHRRGLLEHIDRQKPATRIERIDLAKLRRFVKAARINAATMSKIKH